MFREKTSTGCIALLLLMMMAVVLPIDHDLRQSFGEIDPAYRSAYPETAWFLMQPGDDATSFADLDGDLDGRETVLAERTGDGAATVALARSIRPAADNR